MLETETKSLLEDLKKFKKSILILKESTFNNFVYNRLNEKIKNNIENFISLIPGDDKTEISKDSVEKLKRILLDIKNFINENTAIAKSVFLVFPKLGKFLDDTEKKISEILEKNTLVTSFGKDNKSKQSNKSSKKQANKSSKKQANKSSKKQANKSSKKQNKSSKKANKSSKKTK
jgi:hypothetical protein